MLIRHSAVELRRVEVWCVLVRLSEKIGEASERELVLVVSVRCGKERDMTRG